MDPVACFRKKMGKLANPDWKCYPFNNSVVNFKPIAPMFAPDPIYIAVFQAGRRVSLLPSENINIRVKSTMNNLQPGTEPAPPPPPAPKPSPPPAPPSQQAPKPPPAPKPAPDDGKIPVFLPLPPIPIDPLPAPVEPVVPDEPKISKSQELENQNQEPNKTKIENNNKILR